MYTGFKPNPFSHPCVKPGACFREPDQKHVWTSVIVLTKCQLKFVIGYAWFQRWQIVKSNGRFVYYLFKDDGMTVRIQAEIPRLLLALTNKFYFANILITPYILRNVED